MTKIIPVNLDKHVIEVGDDKIIINVLPDDNKIKISIPGTWDISAMVPSAARKRIDLATQPAQAKTKAKAKVKAKAKATPDVDITTMASDSVDKPVRVRRRRRTKAQMEAARAKEAELASA